VVNRGHFDLIFREAHRKQIETAGHPLEPSAFRSSLCFNIIYTMLYSLHDQILQHRLRRQQPKDAVHATSTAVVVLNNYYIVLLATTHGHI